MNPNYIVDNYKILSNSLKKQIELLPKLSSTSTKTIIKQYNEEELIICNKIRKIPLYFCYFAPIISVKFLNNQNNYILISRQDLIPFYDFFSKLPENQFNHYVINSYLHLKKAFQILNQEDILYINYGKIGFNYQNQPLIFDFERNVNDLEHLPLEQYVISFLEKSQSVSLSKENIENINKFPRQRALNYFLSDSHEISVPFYVTNNEGSSSSLLKLNEKNPFKFSSFPIESGIDVNLLLSRRSRVKLVRFPIELGIDVKLLVSRLSEVKLVRFPIEAGRDSRLLLYKSSRVKFLRLPIDSGSDVSLLPAKSNSLKFLRFPIESGRDVSLLPTKSNLLKFLRFPTEDGRDSTLLLYKFSAC